MSMLAPNVRKAIWDSLLTAEFNSRYWAAMARRFSQRDKAAKIFLAVTASSTVATWGIWQDYEILWKILSGLSALLAVAHPIVDWSKESRSMTELATTWKSLHSGFQFAWVDLEDGRMTDDEIRAEFRRLRSAEDHISSSDNPMPEDRKLAERIQAAVLQSRGLK